MKLESALKNVLDVALSSTSFSNNWMVGALLALETFKAGSKVWDFFGE